MNVSTGESFKDRQCAHYIYIYIYITLLTLTIYGYDVYELIHSLQIYTMINYHFINTLKVVNRHLYAHNVCKVMKLLYCMLIMYVNVNNLILIFTSAILSKN